MCGSFRKSESGRADLLRGNLLYTSRNIGLLIRNIDPETLYSYILCQCTTRTAERHGFFEQYFGSVVLRRDIFRHFFAPKREEVMKCKDCD